MRGRHFVERLGFCWVCLVGNVLYNTACDWWICDNCGAVALKGEQLYREGIPL